MKRCRLVKRIDRLFSWCFNGRNLGHLRYLLFHVVALFQASFCAVFERDKTLQKFVMFAREMLLDLNRFLLYPQTGLIHCYYFYILQLRFKYAFLLTQLFGKELIDEGLYRRFITFSAQIVEFTQV